MTRQRIFISSVQCEFANERGKLCNYIRQDPLLKRFFDPFLFEELPAIDLSVQQAYLSEVNHCHIYLALLGQSYGLVNDNEISPTEKEFDEATALHKYRICFIKTLPANVQRERRETVFIKKVEQVVVRKSFEDYEELQSAVYASLVRYLEERELLRFLPFDAAHHPHTTLADIDPEKITTFIQKAKIKRNSKLKETMSPKQLLTHLDLLDSQGRVTNAAILLFGKTPQRFFISSEVKCIQFYGNEMVKPVPVYQVYRGDLFELIEQALSFVLSRIDIKVGTRDFGSEAPTEYELPVLAVSEAIVNAIAHRDYTSNGSIQVMLFRNRLEIWNPGTLPQGLSIEKLYLPHTSIPGNPLIANSLFLTGDIEKVGTGISDMIDKCVSMKLKKTAFTQDEGFKVTLWRHTETENDIANDTVDDIANDIVGDMVNDIVNVRPNDNLTEKQKAVLEFCSVSRTPKEILAHVSVKRHPDAIRLYIAQLVEMRLLKMTIPDKPNHPRQTYISGQIDNTLEKVTEKDTEKDTEKISLVQEIILQEISNNKCVTIPELSEKVKINIRNVKNNIAKLKTKGLIERIGPDKGGYWKIIKQ